MALAIMSLISTVIGFILVSPINIGYYWYQLSLTPIKSEQPILKCFQMKRLYSIRICIGEDDKKYGS